MVTGMLEPVTRHIAYRVTDPVTLFSKDEKYRNQLVNGPKT
jgi:hypothetical protein